MAKGLDELIEYLLEEIALGGETGITFLGLAVLVQQFYQPSPDSEKLDGSNHASSSSDSTGLTKSPVQFVVDRPLLSKIWSWLARHSDVSIGKNRADNNRSLDDVERIYPGYTTIDLNADLVVNPPNQPTNANVSEADSELAQPAGQQQNGPRISVNKTRMYIAICGHVPDPTRVFVSEWVLLQCIAATRKEGILQGDLVRASGQDKRSVPKRTEALKEKGYIEKKILFMKGNKTSRLILRRFAEVESSSSTTAAIITDHLTVAHVARQLFDVLKNNPLIPQEDLGDVLGLTRPGRARILLQLIRHFAKIGCLKRVKTAFGPSARAEDLRVCIQFLREPSDEDWADEATHEIDLNQPVEILASLYEAEAEQAVTAHAAADDGGLDTERSILATDADVTNDTRLIIPQWNPDRMLANVMLEAARAAGLNGVSNATARNAITGPFIKRTLESLFVKLSIRSLQAQPLGLKHLAILRHQELFSGILHYIHYAFDAFREKVRAGQAKWADVSGGEKFQNEFQKSGQLVPDTLHHTEVDQFGFVARKAPALQIRNGEITTSQLIKDALKAKTIVPRRGEPELREIEGGKLQLVSHTKLSSTRVVPSPAKRRSHRSPKGSRVPVAQPEVLDESEIELRSSDLKRTTLPSLSKPNSDSKEDKVVKGRPRKFARGTEKYWRDVFLFMIQERIPDYFKQHGKRGITSDPEAQQVFLNRPQGFDDIIIQAIESGLPVAAATNDINQQWMDAITAVMNRSQPGLYITPVGYHIASRRQHSQFLIFRSSRLTELNWSDRTTCWPWQLITSSASHSFRYKRFYLNSGTAAQPMPASAQPSTEEPKLIKETMFSTSGPPRGMSLDATTHVENQISEQADLDKQSKFPISSDLTVGELTDVIEINPEIFGENHVALAPKRNRVEVMIPPRRSSATILEKPWASADKENSLVVSPKAQEASRRTKRKKRDTVKVAETLRAHASDITVISSFSDTSQEHVEVGAHRAQGNDALQDDQQQRNDVLIDNESRPHEAPDGHDNQDDQASNVDADDIEAVSALLKKFQRPETQTVTKTFNCGYEEHAGRNAQSLPFPTDTIPSPQVVPDTVPTLVDDTDQTAETQEIPVPSGDPQLEYLAPHDHQVSATLDEVIADPTPSTMSVQTGKRPRTGSEASQLNPRVEQGPPETPPRKRFKKDGAYGATRLEVSKLCRILVLELIGLCSGLAPNIPWTIRRACVPRWHEANVSTDQLSAKNIRAAIKALCESGKLKQLTFAFRGKSGAMVKMSVIGLRGMEATNPAVLELQKKMADAEPADYIPPELEAECCRVPNDLNRQRYSKELEKMSEELIAEQPKSTKPSRRQNKQKAKDLRPATPEQHLDSANPPVTATEPEASASPEPEPIVTLNTGFLTLKVSRLRELHLSTDTRLEQNPPTIVDPARQLHPELDPDRSQVTLTDLEQRVNRRRKEVTKLNPDTERVIRRRRKKFKLPSCLDDVPNIKLTREQIQLDSVGTSTSGRFEKEVDCVAAWEERFADLYTETRAESSIFINHICCTRADTSDLHFETIEFKAMVEFSSASQEATELEFPEAESWVPFAVALQTLHGTSIASAQVSDGRRTRKLRKRKASTAENADGEGHTTPQPKRRKPNKNLLRPRRTLRTALDQENTDVAPQIPPKRTRITQLLRSLTDEEKYQFVVAVVIVRTLTGGIDRCPNWDLITRLIPGHEESTIRDAWKALAHRYRSEVREVQECFTYRYLLAFEAGSVPSVNFDDVHASDWEGIYRWSLGNLDQSIVKRVDDLPTDRTQLLRRNDYVFSEPKSVRDLLAYNVSNTVPRKEETMSATIFGTPLQANDPGLEKLGVVIQVEAEESDVELTRAKSWIMATLLAPEDSSFDMSRARDKLLTLAPTPRQVETILEKAIKALQRDRLVSFSRHILNIGNKSQTRQRNRGEYELENIRRYEISARFFEQFEFRRLITTAMLKRAAKYKLEVLDVTFKQSGGMLTLAKDSALDDGEMVAILNLLAMNMIRMRPGSDVPASRWGLEWEKHGYTTRMVDKRVLAFSVIIYPVKYAYTYGDPLFIERSAIDAKIPRGEIDAPDGQGRIPIWFDILHQFHGGMWETVLGTILGIISIRPGVDVREITKTLAYGISPGEVEMVLGWAERLDLIKTSPSRNGWETCPWWWMGVGVGEGWRVDDNTITQIAEPQTVTHAAVATATADEAVVAEIRRQSP